MGQVDEMIELMRSAGLRWSTAQGLARRWVDDDLRGAALRRTANSGGPPGSVQQVQFTMWPLPPGRRSAQAERTSRQRFWVDKAGHRRRLQSLDSSGSRLSVENGPRWWSYHPKIGSVTGEVARGNVVPRPDGLDDLLDPSAVAEHYDFEAVDTRGVSTRAGTALRASPKPSANPADGVLPAALGATHLMVVVDWRSGALLRVEAHFEGRPFLIIELQDLLFDVDFDDGLFVFSSPDNSSIRTMDELRPVPISLADARQLAPFNVLAPSWLPDGARLDQILWRHPVERPPAAAAVIMLIIGRRGGQRMSIIQTNVDTADDLVWEPVTHDGRQLELLEQPGRPGTVVRLRHAGTYLWADSTFPQEETLAVLTSVTET